MNKKTEYALITQEQFSNMRAALQEYQQQHANNRDAWRKQADIPCGCWACTYAEKANVSTAQTFAPIFIPHDIPWHEEDKP